ncbi:MAG: hypothetical protein HY738_12490, partial [Bacteroidia bacterium]|nr:hypothetical protein [Bacteroidia bacterium]
MKLLTLFDSGARNSYITQNCVETTGIKPAPVKRPFKVGLGGEERSLKEYVNIDGLLQKKAIIIHPFVVNDLGTNEKGKPIEILFGIMDMEAWFVDLDFRRKKI